LGLKEKLIKAMQKHGMGFEYSRKKIPKLCEAKLKQGIFTGPQFRETINDDLFEHLLTKTEKSAWLTFKAVCVISLETLKPKTTMKLLRTSYAHTRIWSVKC
jgi:hypothetical protein